MQGNYHSEDCETQQDSAQHDTNNPLNDLLIFVEKSERFLDGMWNEAWSHIGRNFLGCLFILMASPH